MTGIIGNCQKMLIKNTVYGRPRNVIIHAMSKPGRQRPQHQTIGLAHQTALLTTTLSGFTLLLLQFLSGTNPLAHFLLLIHLTATLYLTMFVLTVLARAAWGDLAPQVYGVLLYRQSPGKLPFFVYPFRLTAQTNQTLLFSLLPRLRVGRNQQINCVDGSIPVYKTALPFPLFGLAPLLLPW